MDLKKLKGSAVTTHLSDGQEVRLTLNFGLLYLLKSRNPDQYKRFFDAFNRMGKPGGDPFFDGLDLIYTGYLCGLLAEGKLEEALGYDAFLIQFACGFAELGALVSDLIGAKKTTASEGPSGAAPTGGERAEV